MYDVLIMDDEPWARQIVKSLGDWDRLGLRIVGEADDGYLGIELAAERKPHIIITDMRMPGLGGDKLLQSLQERFPNVKILIMSGYEDFSYLKQAIQSKAVNYMLKPISAEELNQSLAECIEQLNKESSESPTPRKATHLDTSVQDRYLTYRKLIQSNLLDLNDKALAETFSQMAQYLDQTLMDEHTRKGMPYKIAYDFIAILEEALVSDDLQPVQLVPQVEIWRESIERASMRDAIKETENLYQEVLRSLQIIRQDRDRLDIDKVKEFIERNYSQAISLETLAKKFAVRKEYLSRQYKARLGETVMDAITRVRMEKAKELLVTNGLSIKRTAELTGFTDITYFYRVFKKFYGIPPGNMRS
ncbi:response regulator transcription factor [Cohnella candidum]|uniref:Response regulator n=1 Tax=Cohnella candidum TaxID=2674991 RepID=A0A3G3K0B4_9BACL|nr:response regulator [Cohnella candidum]AYQ73557.1 response regulator [Cohnella candidum]